jgi:hypothetical protein
MATLLEQFIEMAMQVDLARTYIHPAAAALLRHRGFTPHSSYLRPPRPIPIPRLPCPGITKAKTPCKNKCAPGHSTCLIHRENPSLRGYPLPSMRCPELVNGEQCKCPKYKHYPLCWRHAKRANLLPPPPEMPTECSICYSDLTHETTVKTSCGHYFHDECFNGWKQTRQATLQRVTCPMCRGLHPNPKPLRSAAAGTAHQNSQANVIVL